jgi:hypothetical protein
MSHILIFLVPFLSFCQNIKSITEFRKEKDTLIKTRNSVFDKSGNLTLEIIYGNYDKRLETYRNNYKIILYEKEIKKNETSCEYFVKQDTCVLRSFKNFDYNLKTKTETITMFESDSLIRFIQHRKKEKRIEFVKTFSWEMFPIKNPDFENAIVLIDTIFYDKKGRKIKHLHYNSNLKKPFIETHKYSNKKYSYQTIGTAKDTIQIMQYTKLQKIIDKKKLDYTFNDSKKYNYEIEYY